MRERMEENEEGGISATGIIILMTTVEVRVAQPEDYDDIVSVVDDWWGRPVSTGLPRLFLDHFHSSSRVGEDSRGLAGFLVAFLSPAQPGVGYVHFVGVRPDRRGAGLARLFCEDFFQRARVNGCREVRAVTAPGSEASIKFHKRLGFTANSPVADYNGPGRSMVTFRRILAGG
ncbi:GNAT family N-acetyltransferase [Protofrankia coriariae]|uniref:GNAT family N-acetyltransferase n=1 Tax=Protofrankia coriariae TaxID=1562887 RepID=UPI001F3D4123|nr:GNAT family N-acetyltransferase [Protofrankia coriariae]